ncbi:MAG: hypothetical protein CL454_00870 [Acidimicrobiaceae bacterium]|nr:hypothetical protein [Acidimicrobiaceae bacterium]
MHGEHAALLGLWVRPHVMCSVRERVVGDVPVHDSNADGVRSADDGNEYFVGPLHRKLLRQQGAQLLLLGGQERRHLKGDGHRRLCPLARWFYFLYLFVAQCIVAVATERNE